MARMARAVIPGVPHHVTQRGNRRMQTFFDDDDYSMYIKLMSEWCGKMDVDIWAYCLMPNHIHLVAVPDNEDGLRRAIGEAHRRYTRHINDRKEWRGYLWQGRFASFAMDEPYLYTAVRYIEMNPVRARLVKSPWDYRWSSAAAHMTGKSDDLVNVKPMIDMVGDWEEFLGQKVGQFEVEKLRKHSRTGRPLGSGDFILRLEKKLGRSLKPLKRGPKLKRKA